MSKDKYDRQTRLWGEGQILISSASVLAVGSDSLSAEILKNLILSGICKVTLVDNTKITEADITSNFFVSPSDLGEPRGKIVLTNLLKLNEDVKGEFYDHTVNAFLINPDNFKLFDLIISSNQSKRINDKMLEMAKKYNKRLIIATTNGLFGLIRLYENYHANMKLRLLENQVNDHRLSMPWKELEDFCLSYKLNELDEVDHMHVPYYVILIQALKELRKEKQNDQFNPKTKSEKEELKNKINSIQKFKDEENFSEAKSYYYFCNADQNKLITPKLEYIFQVVNDDTILNLLNKSNDIMKVFFIYCLCLKEFYEKYKTFPVVGNIPDMTADTNSYIKLKKVYQEKADKDKEEIKKILNAKLEKLNFENKEEIKKMALTPDVNYIDFVDILNKNWPQVSLFKYIESEDLKLNLEQFEEDYQKLNLNYFILFKAADLFFENNQRYPGQTNDFKEDIPSFKKFVDTIKEKIVKENQDLTLDMKDDYIFEFCRMGFNCAPPVVSMVGDIASQEAIKLITYQFETVKNYILYNGVDVLLSSFEA